MCVCVCVCVSVCTVLQIRSKWWMKICPSIIIGSDNVAK